MNNDGSNKTVVYTGDAGRILAKPRFSPDAQWITFHAAGVGIYVVERATGVATVLLTNAQCGGGCFSTRFSPSGTRVAVTNTDTTNPRILTVPPTGGTPQVLYSGPAGVHFLDVAWSTDETRIAVIETGGGLPNRLRVIDLQTLPPTPRTILQAATDTSFIVLDWARNNVNRLVFDVVPNTSTQGTIYTVDFTDTTVSTPVLVTGGRNPSFSPDNANMVYVRHLSGNRTTLSRFNFGTGAFLDLGGGGQPDWKR